MRHDKDGRKAEIYKEIIAEQDRSDDRNVLQKLRQDRVRERVFERVADGHIAADLQTHQFADELSDAGAEDRQRKSCYILICPQRDGQEAEDQRADGSRRERSKQCDRDGNCANRVIACDLSVNKGSAESERAAHEHQTLNAEVHVAGFFGQDLAGCAEKERSAVEYSGPDQSDDIKVHLLPPFPDCAESCGN